SVGRGVTPAAFDCTAWFEARRRGETPPPVPARKPGGMPSCGAATDSEGAIMRVQAGGMTMAQLANFMGGFAVPERRPIVDRTGLTGRYDFDGRVTLYSGLPGDAPPPLAFLAER